jgi:Lysozyme inhibitor LprI
MRSSVLRSRISNGAKVTCRLPRVRAALWLACFISWGALAQDARFNQEDARLNRAYQRRVTQLSANPQRLAELRRQELDWIKQRDQKCGHDVACLAESTKARADYLEQQAAQESSETPPGEIPQELVGKWIIRRVLPTDTIACLDSKKAQILVGTEIEYRTDSFRWKTTTVRSSGSSTNMLGAQEFAQGNSGSGSHVDFSQLGIAASAVKQITVNHPAVKIAELSQNGSEIMPGESVLVEGPNTVIVDVCNTYFEARRE